VSAADVAAFGLTDVFHQCPIGSTDLEEIFLDFPVVLTSLH
jgi:hypothetical protein